MIIANKTSLPLTVKAHTHISRRQFLQSSAGLGLSAAGMALLSACGVSPAQPGAQAAVLETTAIRLASSPSVCQAPNYLAEEFLKGEGFTEIQYNAVSPAAGANSLVSGDVDMGMFLAASLVTRLDAGDPILGLAGVHVGCFILFGSDRVNTILDLKGSNVAVTAIGSPEYLFLSTMAVYVGLDPVKDINWVTHPPPESKQLFSEGKVDAILAFPPVAQELRAKKIGHEVVNSMMDAPWSGYYCCMIAANRDFALNNPVATKAVVRSILKAADICAKDPARAAKLMVDKGYAADYDYALQAMQEIPYGVWRKYEPADTMRFYALRLKEAGLVTGSPEELIARGSDWHFLEEIKKEV